MHIFTPLITMPTGLPLLEVQALEVDSTLCQTTTGLTSLVRNGIHALMHPEAIVLLPRDFPLCAGIHLMESTLTSIISTPMLGESMTKNPCEHV